jgi:hypothetical protein
MTHFLTSDEKYSDTRAFSGDYRFGKSAGGRKRAATTLARTGCLKTAIEAIADSKMRRMEHELELCGIRFERSNSYLGARNPGGTGKD